MCLSLFFAQVIGCYLFLISLAMLVHQQRFKKTMNEFLGSHALVALSGGMSLVIGLLIVISHNIWVSQWPVVVTIVGWVILLQALMRIFFPDAFVKMMKDMMAKTGYLLMSWIWLLVGIYLIWAGFAN
jgi:uncharacterized membrane protein YczE